MRRIAMSVSILLVKFLMPAIVSATPLALAPVADAFTQIEYPDVNRGIDPFIRAGFGHGDERRSLLKFDVPAGTIVSAQLRIHVERGNGQPSTVHSVADSSWTESQITWNNQPNLGPNVGTFSTDPGWRSVDVTQAVDSGKLNSFAITKEGEVSKMTSREGSNTPELVVEIGSGTSAVVCQGREASIEGTGGDDVLSGTAGRDVIAARGGNDVVTGRDGSDLICGGDGRDRLVGNGGDDSLAGGRGDDVLSGGPRDDVVKGGGGDDSLHGGGGRDRLIGSPGTDTGNGGSGSDLCRTEVRRNC